jgi:hypothetical protein
MGRPRALAFILLLVPAGDPLPTGAVVRLGTAAHLQGVIVVAYSPDGKRLATGGPGETVRVWDTATGKSLFQFKAKPSALAFSPDGEWLATDGAGQGRALVYHVATGKPYRTLTAAPAALRGVAFAPDGRMAAAVAVPDTLVLFELATGKERLRYSGKQGGIRAFSFSPDGRTMATAGEDGTVLLWDTRGQSAHALDWAKLGAPERERLWLKLTGADAAEANRILASMRRAPVPAVAFLRTHLVPIAPPPPMQLKNLIDALVDDNPERRVEANHVLAQMEDLSRPELRRTLKTTQDPQIRKAVQQLLDKMEDQPIPRVALQQMRAIELLEQLDTPDARELLGELANGAPAARQTREALAALNRLIRR